MENVQRNVDNALGDIDETKNKILEWIWNYEGDAQEIRLNILTVSLWRYYYNNLLTMSLFIMSD